MSRNNRVGKHVFWVQKKKSNHLFAEPSTLENTVVKDCLFSVYLGKLVPFTCKHISSQQNEKLSYGSKVKERETVFIGVR